MRSTTSRSLIVIAAMLAAGACSSDITAPEVRGVDVVAPSYSRVSAEQVQVSGVAQGWQVTYNIDWGPAEYKIDNSGNQALIWGSARLRYRLGGGKNKGVISGSGGIWGKDQFNNDWTLDLGMFDAGPGAYMDRNGMQAQACNLTEHFCTQMTMSW